MTAFGRMTRPFQWIIQAVPCREMLHHPIIPSAITADLMAAVVTRTAAEQAAILAAVAAMAATKGHKNGFSAPLLFHLGGGDAFGAGIDARSQRHGCESPAHPDPDLRRVGRRCPHSARRLAREEERPADSQAGPAFPGGTDIVEPERGRGPVSDRRFAAGRLHRLAQNDRRAPASQARDRRDLQPEKLSTRQLFLWRRLLPDHRSARPDPAPGERSICPRACKCSPI